MRRVNASKSIKVCDCSRLNTCDLSAQLIKVILKFLMEKKKTFESMRIFLIVNYKVIFIDTEHDKLVKNPAT